MRFSILFIRRAPIKRRKIHKETIEPKYAKKNALSNEVKSGASRASFMLQGRKEVALGRISGFREFVPRAKDNEFRNETNSAR